MKKLIHKNGNLLTAKDVEVIGHQANCQNTFGSGIARTIKEMYPEAYHVDTICASKKQNVLGSFSCAAVNSNKHNPSLQYIFNLYGQNLYGKGKRQTNYDAIYTALEGMKNYLIETSEDIAAPNVGFPHLMGCGLGGGDWRIVERLIEVAFHNYNGEVIVYKYKQ